MNPELLDTPAKLQTIVDTVVGDKDLIWEMLTGEPAPSAPPPLGPSRIQAKSAAKKSGGPTAQAMKGGPGIWPMKL